MAINKEVCLLVFLTLLTFDVWSEGKQEASETTEKLSYPDNVFFGDTHVHTHLSVDANTLGNKLLTAEQAYRFAQGETVTANNGMKAELHRPLDFLVVADHAENMGVIADIEATNPALLELEKGKSLNDMFTQLKASGFPLSNKNAMLLMNASMRQYKVLDKHYRAKVWQSVTAAADQFNRPGQFTTFSGFEWSGSGHRVVIFKDDASKTKMATPFSAFDSRNPEDLWRYLSDYESSSGGQVLAIPHNPNVSGGKTFNIPATSLNKDYARTRSRWEPLLEVTQMKGDSETHPILSPDDEFADYETWNSQLTGREPSFEYKKNEDGSSIKVGRIDRGPKMIEKTRYEYARSALKLGLGHQAAVGINPFKFGLIGSTDSHTSLSTADENNFWGKTTRMEPHPSRLMERGLLLKMPGWHLSASGYAAVWAHENTREALFAAMKRKETYATTGPRMEVRFFGGWDYRADDVLESNLARVGYSKGIPMGGDLTSAPKNQSPRFLIQAVKDPDGANLDRVQVVKGWRNNKGDLQEKVYNVALSDDRRPDKNGDVLPLDSTVNIKNASYTNSIGDPELVTVWEDPDFDRTESAFYYLRVIEIPTPRWTAYDAKKYALADIPEDVQMVTQERAYTSPIWYSP